MTGGHDYLSSVYQDSDIFIIWLSCNLSFLTNTMKISTDNILFCPWFALPKCLELNFSIKASDEDFKEHLSSLFLVKRYIQSMVLSNFLSTRCGGN